MEEISKTSIPCISISRDKKKAPDDQNGVPLIKKRKRSAAMRLFKVAVCMLRMKSGKSKSKSIQVDVDWQGIVGSMRPMHLQSNQSPSPAIKARPEIMTEPESIPRGEQTEEVITPPFSPMAYSISSYGSVSDMSQYGSPCEEITKEKCWYDDDGGDEMIDAKAEEFIAHFYEQMRLQNVN